jgi:hypothetical protein
MGSSSSTRIGIHDDDVTLRRYDTLREALWRRSVPGDGDRRELRGPDAISTAYLAALWLLAK